MIGLGQYLGCMMSLQLTCGDILGVLAGANQAGIPLFDIRWKDEITVVFSLRSGKMKEMELLIQKKGGQIRYLGRRGLGWKLRRVIHRPVLLMTVLVLLALSCYIPSRVLFVRIEGNKSIPANQILEAAEKCGIRFGASRRAVRSEKVKNALLSQVPGLEWAGVNTYGCVAVISLRERAEQETAQTEREVSSIVAARDGVILSCTVTRGNGLCVPGQAVKAGEILISGLTDCGICVTATQAQGEVFAFTNRSLTVKMPAQSQKRGSESRSDVKYSLIIGKKRINFYKGSGISGGTCVKMYTEYILSLPGGFPLPIVLVKETVSSCPVWADDVEESQAAVCLKEFVQRYLQQKMVAGVIVDRLERLTLEADSWTLVGEYGCTEMIGQRQEEIGVIP